MNIHRLPQLDFELVDEIVPPGLNLVLPLEQLTPLLVAGGLQGSLQLLMLELLGKRRQALALGAALLDATVQLLDRPLQGNLEVVSPGVELLGLV